MEARSHFEPGIDLHAKVTVFGEGSRGSLTKTLIKKFKLDEGKNPQGYVVGVKEVWEVPEGRMQPGDVIHTMGYPLKSNTYGGGFIYGMRDNKLSIGLLTGLEYADPFMDPHREFQRLKQHPYIAGLLKDGKMIQYGAKTAPVGGYFSVPKLTFAGGLLVGDSASLFIGMKLKGIHAAMKSGMLAAETIFASMLKDDFSEKALEGYPNALRESSVGRELYLCDNFHKLSEGVVDRPQKAGFQCAGRENSLRLARGQAGPHPFETGFRVYGKRRSRQRKGDVKCGKCTADKETDVYYSGTTHEEKQPPHLKILDLETCYNRCTKEFQNPCVRFCPAHVYEMEVDEQTGQRRMKLNFSNCVHCKTCDVKDPYENINWVPPEGGGGPKYTVL
jgi:electron-transferring-flavoprotein dehydrogenase